MKIQRRSMGNVYINLMLGEINRDIGFKDQIIVQVKYKQLLNYGKTFTDRIK